MGWFTTIKHSDDKTKKAWIVFLSGISMIIVIISWAWYMNFYISDVGTQKYTDIDIDETRFWPVFKTGIIVITDSLKEEFNSLTSEVYSKISKIGGGKVIKIENNQ